MSKLKIAIQKNGRLTEKSVRLLEACGISFSNGDRKLLSSSKNFPVDLLYLRDDDIPQAVELNVADAGILGENEVIERDKKVTVIEKLGFGTCRLSLAIPKDEEYTGPEYFTNKKIATGYPVILNRFFHERGIPIQPEIIGGSVEIATSIGLADAVFDIVSTGSTLLMNGLKEAETVMKSVAVLIANPSLSDEKNDILNNLLFRIRAVKKAKEHKYILLNAPNESVPAICNLLPAMKSPTVLPLAETGWCSLHSVIREDDFWEVIDRLKQAGAQGILVVPIEKMIV